MCINLHTWVLGAVVGAGLKSVRMEVEVTQTAAEIVAAAEKAGVVVAAASVAAAGQKG